MRKFLLLFLASFLTVTAYAQELNCNVTINSDKVPQTNKQVFTTLRTAVTDFMNNTRWSNRNYGRNERIDCNVIIIIETANANNFTASIQVQSSRPAYNSTYNSPVFNFKDDRFAFQYIEFEPLNYSENNYSSELIGVLSYYANIIVGLDADTFSMNGGTSNLEKALNIMNMAQQGGGTGWKQADGNNSRYFLISDMLNGTYSGYREALYIYHRTGIDLMADNPLEGKKGVKAGLDALSKIHRVRPNALMTRIFFDAKSDEIASVFAAGPDLPAKQEVVDMLNRIFPLGGAKWNRM